jgi:hypothetical protein
MTSKRTTVRGGAAWFALAWGVVVACGGRSVEQRGTDDPASGRAGELPISGAGGAISGAGGASGGGGGSGGVSSGTGGGQGGDFPIGKGSPDVNRACSNFCGTLPASCSLTGTDGCAWDCIHGGNDSPSCTDHFASYIQCLAGHLDPAASCDRSCSGAPGCAGEAIAICAAESGAWEACFEQCGTKTRDYEAPSVGCRRASACNSQVVECLPNADHTIWECTCFEVRPDDGARGVSVDLGEEDACLAAARKCQEL